MDPGVVVPVATFGVAVLIVAIFYVAKIRDLETEVARRIHAEQLEHQKKMQQLNLELERVKARQG